MIDINQILAPMPGQKAKFEGTIRVVGISACGRMAAVIRLDVLPICGSYIVPISDINPDDESNHVRSLDSYALAMPASEKVLIPALVAKLKKVQHIMHSVTSDGRVIMDPDLKVKKFQRIADAFGINPRTVRRYFNNYLWGGMTVRAD